MLGDGELQEGEVWEGAMCAAHYKLDNLCVIIDYNKLQSDDSNENVLGLEPLRAKWEAFNWRVFEIDGHNFNQIEQAFVTAQDAKGSPSVIIAHTIKGKGVSFMEGVPAWHGSVKLRPEELEQALHDLDTPEADIPAYLDGSIWSR
jgi:transketolase